MNHDLWIGVDPGLTCTGVIVEQNDFFDYCTFTAASIGSSFARASTLARDVLDYLQGVVDEIDSRVGVAIELPVYKKHPKNFIKQCRVLQEIQMGIIMTFPWATVYEINPKQSKKVLTGNGNATKKDMIAAAQVALPFPTMPYEDLEAICDAYGHLLAAQHGAAEAVYDPESWFEPAVTRVKGVIDVGE